MAEKLSKGTNRTTVFIPQSLKDKLPDRVNLSGLIRDLLQEHLDGNKWKAGFKELFTFFSDILENKNIIRNQSRWNDLLQKRNLVLIDKLGDEL